jgi:hypothetical protein
MQALVKLSEFNEVTLVWIPGQQEILPKEGATRVPPSQTAVVPFTVGEKLLKSYLKLGHQARWDACAGCSQSLVSGLDVKSPSSDFVLGTWAYVREGICFVRYFLSYSQVFKSFQRKFASCYM